jgi:hypothetical protein
MGIDYLDFDLHILRSGSDYYVEAESRSSGQQASTTFKLDAHLWELAKRLSASSVIPSHLTPPQNPALDPDPPPSYQDALAFGRCLFTAVFKDGVKLALFRCMDAALAQTARVRVRLRLTDVPELAALPWEYLSSGERDQNDFLALDHRIALVRFPDRNDTVSALPVTPPLRILVVAASPRGLPRLDADGEWALIQAALQPVIERGRVELDRCTPATFAQLDLRLRQTRYHVLHFIGHGAFVASDVTPSDDTRKRVGQLVLEDDSGERSMVDNRLLGPLCHNHESLRLIVLNTCEGAAAGDDDAQAGLAQHLVQTGVPAVIAMQRSISDQAAKVLAAEFYRVLVLAEGSPVEAALFEARTRLRAVGDQLEWATPALYLRALETRLFSIETTSDAELLQFQVAQHNRLADAAIAAEDWPTAITNLETITRIQPNTPGLADRIRHALTEKELAELFERGRQLLDSGKMEQAFAYFSQVYNLSKRNYKGVWSYMDIARRQVLNGTSTPTGGVPLSEEKHVVEDAEPHYTTFLKSVVDEGIVIVLGGDINMCSRLPGLVWRDGSPYPPTRADLAEFLANEVRYPKRTHPDLVSVSQYYALKEGQLALREKLRSIFEPPFNPPALHRLLATLPESLRKKGYSFRKGYPLILTTNYDTCLEQAFDDAGEQYDLLAYAAEGDAPATFVHRSPDGVVHELEGKANEYLGILSEPSRTVILKVHAAISPPGADSTSYVVAEDDYIDYPSGKELVTLLPKTVLLKLKRSRLVFFGYTPRDWSLRVFFRRIWGAQPFTGYKSFAVTTEPDEIDEDFWKMRFVDVLQVPIDMYVAMLSDRLDNYPVAEVRR